MNHKIYKICDGASEGSGGTDFDISKKSINPMGGWPHYGLIRGDCVMLKGGVPGPKKRVITLRKALRTHTSRAHLEKVQLKVSKGYRSLHLSPLSMLLLCFRILVADTRSSTLTPPPNSDTESSTMYRRRLPSLVSSRSSRSPKWGDCGERSLLVHRSWPQTQHAYVRREDG